jgi:hypothetical protein
MIQHHEKTQLRRKRSVEGIVPQVTVEHSNATSRSKQAEGVRRKKAYRYSREMRFPHSVGTVDENPFACKILNGEIREVCVIVRGREKGATMS